MRFKLILAFGLISALLTACSGGASAPASTEVRPAPDFTLPNALGGEVSLNDYAGEPVFLFFHMAVG
jgi:cytochrome oxidase Cu insertion factor (SCO1/SenC/PrrC family)